jgi:hypothetical protein
MSSNVIRPSSKPTWFAATVIAGLLLTGCASHHPATAGPHTAPTHQASCPPGTHQRGGECLSNGAAALVNSSQDPPTCVSGTHLRAGECLNNVHLTRINDS